MDIERGMGVSESDLGSDAQFSQDNTPDEVVSYSETEIGSIERETVRNAAQVTISNWEQYYNQTILSDELSWSDKLSMGSDRINESNSTLKELGETNPELANALENINRCLGGIPALFEANASLGKLRESMEDNNYSTQEEITAGLVSTSEYRNYSHKEKMSTFQSQARIAAAWQRDAIWSLLALDSMEFEGKVPQGTTKRFIDVLTNILSNCEKVAYNHDHQKVTKSIKKGIFGPVKYAMISKKAGYKPYVAPVNWDVNGKIDMLSEINPNQFLATQIKSSSDIKVINKQFPIKFITNPNRLKDDKSKKDFNRVSNYCQTLEAKPEWQDSKFYPAWMSMWSGSASSESFKDVIGGNITELEVEYFRSFVEQQNSNNVN